MLTLLVLPAEGGGLNPFDPSSGGGMLWTWVIFLAALPFMWKVVMGPIAKALEERDELASKAVRDAQQASANAERASAEVEQKLTQARAEAAALLAEARDRATLREREILDAAKGEAQALLDGARRAIQTEQEKAIAAIREEVVDLSIAGARAVLERNVGTEDDRRLVARMVGEMKAAGR